MNRIWQSFFSLPKYQTMGLKEAQANWQLGMASWETIFHRTMMMGDAFQGRRSLSDPEFSRMWQEKVHATLEGGAAVTLEMQSLLLQTLMNPGALPRTAPKALDKMLHQSSRLMKAAITPARSKANRNAKRLRRKAISSTFK